MQQRRRLWSRWAHGGIDAESDWRSGWVLWRSAFLNPMERQVDGDETVGSLKQLDSAEEPGKSALFPHIFIYTFCKKPLNMIKMIYARSLQRSDKINLCMCLHSLLCLAEKSLKNRSISEDCSCWYDAHEPSSRCTEGAFTSVLPGVQLAYYIKMLKALGYLMVIVTSMLVPTLFIESFNWTVPIL